MTVKKYCIFAGNPQRGDSILEVLLAMAVVAMIVPFLYTQISDSTQTIRDMAVVQKVIDLRNPILNFVRINQGTWPDVVQIKLSDAELDAISEFPTSGFIDRYAVRGASVTDIYLAFDFGADLLRTNHIARMIGIDAAVVGDDGVAHGRDFAVAAPEFKPGNLIYRISRDMIGEDKSKYLHRGAAGGEGLNTMLRDLNMGGNNVFDVGSIIAKSARIKNATTTFIETEALTSESVYFSSGANLSGGNLHIGNMRVSGDISGFRNINADNMNGRGYTTSGSIIADRANVTNSVNVSRNLVLKSDTARTVSGFTAISANSVATSHVSTEEIIFFEDFGLTISGELLMSTTSPLKIGSWSFPSTTPPRFSVISFSRAEIPASPMRDEFGPLMMDGWRSIPNKDMVVAQ